jgi:hypothetical protein
MVLQQPGVKVTKNRAKLEQVIVGAHVGMALPKRDIEIKTVSNVQDSLGQARRNDGKMVELQHVSEAACNAGRLWHAI